MPRADPQGVGELDRLATHRMCNWKKQGDELQKPQTSEAKKRLLSVAAPPRSSPRCSLCPPHGPEFQPAVSIRVRPDQRRNRRLKRPLRASAPEPDRSALSRPENGCSRTQDTISPQPRRRVSRLTKEYPDKSVPVCEFPFFPRESSTPSMSDSEKTTQHCQLDRVLFPSPCKGEDRR